MIRQIAGTGATRARLILASITLLGCVGLFGCGQRGPLYLPKDEPLPPRPPQTLAPLTPVFPVPPMSSDPAPLPPPIDPLQNSETTDGRQRAPQSNSTVTPAPANQ